MMIFVFPQHGSLRKRMGDIRGREWICVAMDRRMGGRLRCFYILLSRSLVSWWSDVMASEQLNEKKFPTISRALAIEVFCVLYSWRFVSFTPAVSPFHYFVSPLSRRRLE